MKKHHLAMRWLLSTVVFLLVSAAVLFPVFAKPNHNMFNQVINSHDCTPLHEGHKLIMHISWFCREKVTWGEDLAIYDGGYARQLRFLWYATEGGSGQTYTNSEIQQLRHDAALLPLGPSSFDATPEGRLLIVSFADGGKWKTLYYDRQNLPTSVQALIRAIKPYDY